MNTTKAGYAILVILFVFSVFISFRHLSISRAERDMLDINTFPMKIGDWHGSALELSEQDYKILETTNLLLREYINSSTGQTLSLFVVYSETNRSVFHPPEVCLMGGGIAMVDKKTEKIDTGEEAFLANKLYLQKNDSRMIALYFYSAGRFYTDNFYLQQAVFAFNQLFNRKKGGATIRVMAHVDNDEEQTVAELKKFMQQVVLIFQSM